MTLRMDLTNKAFARLTVLAFAGVRKRHIMWECICQCGKKLIVESSSLRSGNTRSCGCLQRETARKTFTTHGNNKDYKSTPEYVAWSGMKRRCHDKNGNFYHRYGGRGISVCKSWGKSFSRFLMDMGPRPTGKSLDRIDNDAGYRPGNCRWATLSEQQRNRSSTVLTRKQIRYIRRYYKPHSLRFGGHALARRFSVSRCTVKSIGCGTSYVNL